MVTPSAEPVRTGSADRKKLNRARELGLDMPLGQLLDICLAENERRLGCYDARLLWPILVPRMVRLARRLLRRPARA